MAKFHLSIRLLRERIKKCGAIYAATLFSFISTGLNLGYVFLKTDLLIEVDHWTRFKDSFTHLRSGIKAENKNLLLTTYYPTELTWA